MPLMAPPSKPSSTSFGVWLANYLSETGISQQTLANDIGVSKALVGQWKRGDVKRPKHEQLVALAGATGEPLEALEERVYGKATRRPSAADEVPPAWALDLMRQVAELNRKLDLLTAAAEGIAEGERAALEELAAAEGHPPPAAAQSASAAPRRRGTRLGSPR